MVTLSVCMSVSLCPFFSLSVGLSLCPFFSLSVGLSLCMSVGLSVRLGGQTGSFVCVCVCVEEEEEIRLCVSRAGQICSRPQDLKT